MLKFFSFILFSFLFSISLLAQQDDILAVNNAFTTTDSSANSYLKKFNLSLPYNLVSVSTTSSFHFNCIEFGASGYLYFISTPSSYNFRLYRIDTINGATTQISTSSLYLQGAINRGLSWDKTSSTMYSIFTFTPAKIYTVNLSTGVFTLGSTLQANDYILAFAISNAGTMYGISSFGGKLIKIDKTTGATTDIGLLNITSLSVKGCDFDPVTGKMYLLNGNGSNTDVYTLDTITGVATQTGTISNQVSLLAIAGNSNIGIKQISSEIPSEFKLYQNYPNPFNPSTSIRYQVENIKHIKLVVYDVLGKEIAVLVNERQSPGIYEVSFDAGSLSSGVYYYKLIGEDFIVTKKMVLLK